MTEGDFVIIIFEQEYFPGVVEKKTKKGCIVSCMIKNGNLDNLWKCPEKRCPGVLYKNILTNILSPKLISKSRQLYSVPELVNNNYENIK